MMLICLIVGSSEANRYGGLWQHRHHSLSSVWYGTYDYNKHRISCQIESSYTAEHANLQYVYSMYTTVSHVIGMNLTPGHFIFILMLVVDAAVRYINYHTCCPHSLFSYSSVPTLCWDESIAFSYQKYLYCVKPDGTFICTSNKHSQLLSQRFRCTAFFSLLFICWGIHGTIL